MSKLVRPDLLTSKQFHQIENPSEMSEGAVYEVYSSYAASGEFSEISSHHDLKTQLSSGKLFYLADRIAKSPLLIHKPPEPNFFLAQDTTRRKLGREEWKHVYYLSNALRSALERILSRELGRSVPPPDWGPQINEKQIRLQRTFDISASGLAAWAACMPKMLNSEPLDFLSPFNPAPDGSAFSDEFGRIIAPVIKPIQTGLGEAVDNLAANSPTLQAGLKQLKEDKWKIIYGTPNTGSYVERNIERGIKISLDPKLQGNAIATVQTLSHEVGHALYKGVVDPSSRESYVNSYLADEGAATLKNIEVQREILSKTKVDIGIAGSAANLPAYGSAYDAFKRGGSEVKAQQAIGQIFGRGERTSNTGEFYADYYGSFYDKYHQ